MLDVIFRKRAEEDLLALQDWFSEVAPNSVERILADIYRSIDLVRENPELAQAVPGHNYRRIVTRKYRFKVASMIKRGRIDILGIYRFQDRAR